MAYRADRNYESYVNLSKYATEEEKKALDAIKDKIVYYAGDKIVKDYKTPSGKTLSVDTSNKKYKYSGLAAGNSRQFDAYMQYFLEFGREPTKAELDYILDEPSYTSAYNNIKRSFSEVLKSNGYDDIDAFNFDSGTPEQSAQEAAFNEYYRDIYSTEAGTTGGDIYNRMVEAEQNAARSNMTLADAQMQQAAMQQASTVKALTDQVKAERMAKLRAGMSEAQIANQDMQMMMTNINALNQQANEMNYAQLQAQQQYNLAQDTAYQQWLDNANVMGQTGAAYAASDAGDVYQQALRIQQRTGMSFAKALEQAQGRNQ